MSYLVLAFPKLSTRDYNWIQKFREKYDDRFYGVVDPHFTIVFPVYKIEKSVFINHVRKQTRDLKSIKFSIRCSTAVKDSFSDYTDIFLTPDEGNSGIIKLHDRLYTGVLRPELRADIPYIVHIAIGASKSAEVSKKLSDKINKQKFCIDGVINTLDIVWYDHPEVISLKKLRLK